MAQTYFEEQKKKLQQAGQQAQAQYSGMSGVSTQTGQRLAQAQTAYNPGQQAQAAQQNLQAVQAQKPQSYTSKYGAALDNILQQIQNPGEFKYSFNGDELFKSYADLYSQQAKQASMNAMGNAAALTGGYGNSYAQAAGSQAYQQAILPLYEYGMNLAQMAQDRYNANRADSYNQLAALQGMEQQDYGRYRDTVSDWQNDLDRAREDSRYERELDYQQYRDNLEYYTGLAQLENQDWNTQAAREEAIRQYNQDFAERQRQFNESLAEQQRATNLDEAYRQNMFNWQQDTDARDYAEAVRQANLDEAYRRDTLDWQKETDQRDYDAAQYRADQDEAYRQQVFNEQMRQTDLDEAYRYATLKEQQRGTNLDEAYRRDTLGWQQDTDARDYAEAVRQANLDEDYRNRTFDESVRQADLDEAYRQKTFDESVRQADLDEAYRQQAFNEQVRQADLDEAYRRDSLAQNQAQFEATTELDWANLAEKQREYDAGLSAEEWQFNQKMATAWVTDILANGQIPSNELLIAAGLSYEDAQKLVAQLAVGGGPGGGNDDDDSGDTSVKKVTKNAGNSLDELGKNIIYNVGNGAESWMKNYMGFGDTADALASIASGKEIDPNTNRAYTDRKKADAAEAAQIMYGMQDQYDANRNKVDAYVNKVKNSTTDGEGARLATAEESAEYIKELRKKGLIK